MHFYKLSSRLWGDVIKVWVWKTSRKNTLAKSVIHKLTKVFLVRNPKFEVGVSMNLKHTKGWHVISETLKTRLVCNYTPTSLFFRWFVKTWRATNQSDFRFWPERKNRAFVFFFYTSVFSQFPSDLCRLFSFDSSTAGSRGEKITTSTQGELWNLNTGIIFPRSAQRG